MANGKVTSWKYLDNANDMAKQGEIWDSGV